MTTKIDVDGSTEWDNLLKEQPDTVVPESFMKVGEIVNKPTESAPAPMQISDLAFKGYVRVWDTITGVESLQPWWLMWQTMRKKREDGSQVFTRTNPHIPPNYGADLFCPLNPEAPEYAQYKAKGFKACLKRHIPHEDALMQHVRKSHMRAFAMMERDREDRIRDEDRQMQRDMLAALTGAAVKGVQADQEAAPLYVSDKPKRPGRKPKARE